MSFAAIGDTGCVPVVYVAWKASSSRTFRCLEPIAGQPLLRLIVHRLRRGFGCRVTVVHHADALTERLRQVLEGCAVTLFETDAVTMPGALHALATSAAHLRHVAVFLEDAPFPDVVTARRMIVAHASANAACTIAPDHPYGLLPIVFRADRIDSLMPADASEWPVSFRRVFDMLAGRATSAADGCDDRTTAVFADRELAASIPAMNLVVSDCRSRRAAAVVVEADHQPCDATAADHFTRALTCVADDRLNISLGLAPAEKSASRILFSSLQDAVTGAEESLLLLMRGLPRQDYLPISVVPTESVLAEKLRANGIGVQVADFPMTELEPQGLRFYRDLLDHYRIDLVHLNVWLNPPLMIAANERCIPIVLHVRLKIPEKWTPPGLLRFVDRAIVVSRFAAKGLRRVFPSERIIEIHNGVDLSALDPAGYNRARLRTQAGIGQEAQVISMIARLDQSKRQDLLIRALELIRHACPRALVWLVGEAGLDRRYAAQLRQLVSELRLVDRVVFTGFEPYVARTYAVSDIVVMANPDEAFARATIEAMAMGVPVIAPRAGGALEQVRDGEEGLLFNPNEVDDLARCLRSVLDDRRRAARMGTAGRATAHRFSLESHVSAVTAVYRTLLDRHETTVAAMGARTAVEHR